jgi:hypothetical protein
MISSSIRVCELVQRGVNADILGRYLANYLAVLWINKICSVSCWFQTVHRYSLPCGSRENRLWLGWLESLSILRVFLELGPSDVCTTLFICIYYGSPLAASKAAALPGVRAKLRRLYYFKNITLQYNTFNTFITEFTAHWVCALRPILYYHISTMQNSSVCVCIVLMLSCVCVYACVCAYVCVASGPAVP